MDPKIEEAMRNARASLAVDGMYLTEEQIQLVRDKITGKISEEEFLRRALEMAKRAGND